MKNFEMSERLFLKIPDLLSMSKKDRNTQILQHLNLHHRSIKYSDSGCPYIETAGDFSLSHKEDAVFAVLNRNPHCSVGCDLEVIPPSPQFPWDIFFNRLSAQERLFIDSTDSNLKGENKLLSLFVCKEALYKASANISDRNGHLYFKNQEGKLIVFEYRVLGRTLGQVYVEHQDHYLLGVCFLERTR